MPDEENTFTTVYRNYSQAQCQLECLIWRSRRRCGCLPWDFPNPRHFFDEDDGVDDVFSVCDHLGQVCFRQAMDRGAEAAGCGAEAAGCGAGAGVCPADCAKEMYTHAFAVSELHAEWECRRGGPLRRLACVFMGSPSIKYI